MKQMKNFKFVSEQKYRDRFNNKCVDRRWLHEKSGVILQETIICWKTEGHSPETWHTWHHVVNGQTAGGSADLAYYIHLIKEERIWEQQRIQKTRKEKIDRMFKKKEL